MKAGRGPALTQHFTSCIDGAAAKTQRGAIRLPTIGLSLPLVTSRSD